MEPNAQEPIKLINVMIRVKNAFFQLWPLVLVLMILGGSVSYVRAKRAFVPLYESKAIFTVESGYTAEDIFGTGAYYDQFAAQEMASAFPHIISTDMMRDLVMNETGKPYINGASTAYAVVDSNMLVLSVTSTVPQDAYEYLNAIIECYPQVAVYMVDNPHVNIMQNPNLPTVPFNSFSGLGSAAKGAILGAVLGMAIVFVCGLLTRTIQTADELKSSINLPILVALPKVVLKKRRNGTSPMITAESDPNMAETLRGLRLKVKKMLEEKGKKTVLVTSTVAGEGKTTVAVNLAYSLVKDGHKVMLLDTDLRSQSVARCLGEKSVGPNLLDCLKGEAKLLDCIRDTKNGKLCFLSGRSTDKRHYTLDHRAIQRLLDQLTGQFDFIIMDAPPSEVVSDAHTLCRCADCVLYVVKQDYAKKSQVLNSVTALHQKDIKIDGCIFNGVPQFHRQYGYGYRSTYGYGYDYGYRKYSYGSKYGYGYGKYAEQKNHD
ncbi:MAG: AAA family ATPase [Oscillospiraceae bacterium]|nr:AAA family ATPase [Oscillospiraceae bacterium]